MIGYTDVIRVDEKPANRIGDTANCLRVAGEMIRDNVFYRVEVKQDQYHFYNVLSYVLYPVGWLVTFGGVVHGLEVKSP
jgi:hypothetical protein